MPYNEFFVRFTPPYSLKKLKHDKILDTILEYLSFFIYICV